MTSFLEGKMAAAIGKGFANVFYAATLTQVSVSGGNGYDPSSGVATTTPYACKGMVDSYSAYDLANSLVQAGDVMIMVLATSLATAPKVDDTVAIRGATYRVINVSIDPARAVWTLQGRV